jgi:magnesium transporter
MSTVMAPKVPEEIYYLTDLIGKRVTFNGKKIGKLSDLVAKEHGTIPSVTFIIVGRPFGESSLVVPWENVTTFTKDEFIITIDNIEKYAVEPPENALLLKDYIIDKKVLDVMNREVEIVYDIKLVKKKNKLYVIAVDISKGRLLKRIKMGFLAYNTPDAIKDATLSWSYIQPLENLSSFSGDIRLKVLREKLSELPPVDLADVLEVLEDDQRTELFASLDTETAAEALDATEPRVQRQILSTINVERITQVFSHLSPMEIADLISILPRGESEEIKQILSKEIAEKVNEIISKHDIPASTLALRRYLAFPGDTVVEVAFIRFRKEAPKSDVTMYIYVIDNEEKLIGVVDINELLQADPETTLEKIMTKNVVTVEPSTMRRELKEMFQKYRFRAIPVVDESRMIFGVVREKDAFQSSRQE